MDKFAGLRGSTADWMVVKSGDWSTDHTKGDFTYDMFSLEYNSCAYEGPDEDLAHKKWVDDVKSKLARLECFYNGEIPNLTP